MNKMNILVFGTYEQRERGSKRTRLRLAHRHEVAYTGRDVRRSRSGQSCTMIARVY